MLIFGLLSFISYLISRLAISQRSFRIFQSATALAVISMLGSWLIGGILVLVGYVRIIRQYRKPTPKFPSKAHKKSYEELQKCLKLIQEKKLSAALKASEKAIEHNPRNAGAWAIGALLLHDLKRYEEALVASEKAIELDPKSAMAWTGKALALYGLGRNSEGFEAASKSVKLDPNPKTNPIAHSIVSKEAKRVEAAKAIGDEYFKALQEKQSNS